MKYDGIDFPFVEYERDGRDGVSLVVGTDEMIRFDTNGEVYVRGQLVDDNKEVYQAFKDWLAASAPKGA